MSQPSPDRIMNSTLAGHATAAIMSAACKHGLFTHIERGAATKEEIADRAAISQRGAQALLDALTGLGFLEVHDGRYTNSDDARVYLVEDGPAYLGAHAQLTHSPFGDAFRDLANVVGTGVPTFEDTADVADNAFFEDLALAIVPLAVPVAQTAADRLAFARAGAVSVLDIGGGSGIFCAVLLQHNAAAKATQIDWPNINSIAKGFVAGFGVGDRFTTIDGDFHTVDLGDADHDVIILSNMCHQESPEQNRDLFRRCRRALRPGGTLMLSEFVLEDDRTTLDPWCGVFQTFMLIQTMEGAAWRKADYRQWLADAGFGDVVFEQTPTPSTLVLARS